LTQPPLWGKRAALVEPLKVTVDRRAVDPEPTGGLAFGDALLYGLYYLGAQIYRAGFHPPMMLGDATSLQAAIEEDEASVVKLGAVRSTRAGLHTSSALFLEDEPLLHKLPNNHYSGLQCS
jgi:hypothetical protein